MVVQAEAVGMDPKGVTHVKALFREQLERGLHPGAAMAVYRHGKLVLDLYGGLADRETGRPVTEDTRFVLFSSTKPLAAVCMHILWERGQGELGEWIADLWPEFGKNGKEHITIRQLLTHTAGFPDTPSELTWDKWGDWDAVVKAMENAKPTYEPGEVIAYHSLNFGWVIGELVRRVDGRPISQFLREEVTEPLGMKGFYMSLPPDQETRVAKIYAMEDWPWSELVEAFNRPEIHQAVVPAANGISTARDLARFYAMWSMRGRLDGVQILTPGTVRGVTAIQREGMDKGNTILPGVESYRKLALGLLVDEPSMGTPRGPNVHTFGHGGAGTSIGWADPDSRLAVAIITNGCRIDPLNTERLAGLSQAVRDACL